MTKDELIHTIKMMGCVILSAEIDNLKALMKERTDNKIDYKELYYLMQNHTPRTVGQVDLDSRPPLSRSLGMKNHYLIYLFNIFI